MEFIILVEMRLDGRTLEVREVVRLERTATGIDPEELGLTLQDGKTELKQVQERIVRTQVELISVAWQPWDLLRQRARVTMLYPSGGQDAPPQSTRSHVSVPSP